MVPPVLGSALQGELRASLGRSERAALPEGTTGGAAIVKKYGEPWIRVSYLAGGWGEDGRPYGQ
ncbi:hypothetical protein SAMN05660976_00301 [Nonomuraea pusilla]|uniref:Uncharacterized protein n=1 Tax=Nonomuraea pusilla TaxID=46177 RepID=A0A1H7GD09_9ACTN|nr:hypothetical protein SAMN05660976_00301 [Nonomuraea pusilla]